VRTGNWVGSIAAALLGAAAAWAAEPTAGEVLRESGIDGGLAVHVGCSDGSPAAALAGTGKFLVHGLVPSDRLRRSVALPTSARGLVAVDAWAGGTLPYASDLVNLIVTSGEWQVPSEEVLRVLAPNGVALEQRGGKWVKTVKPWPQGADDWTHWCYGPEGNAVSHDKLVKPCTSLKWIVSQLLYDVRVAGGRLFSPLEMTKDQRRRREPAELRCRDAFNGLLRWSAPTGRPHHPWPAEFVATRDLVFHFPDVGTGFAAATDARTGKTARTFDQGLKRSREQKTSDSNAILMACGGTLVQAHENRVVALDIATGARRWEFTAQKGIGNACAAADGSRVYVQETENHVRNYARWCKHNTAAITCIADGKQLWRNEALAGEEASDLVLSGDALVVFDPVTNLGDDGDHELWVLNPADGAVRWHSPKKKAVYNVMLNSPVVRGTQILIWGPFNNLLTYDYATGEEFWWPLPYNQRCVRLSATDDWLIYGLTTWVDRDLNVTQFAYGRSDCSFPAFPAQGHVYFGSNVTCTCINPVRGLLAVSPEPPRPEVSDDRRLDARGAEAPPTELPRPRGNGEGTRGAEAPPTGNSLATREWQPNPFVFYFHEDRTPPVEAGGVTLVADVHRHRLVARKGGRPLWSFAAPARIRVAPTIADGRVYVGCTDGRVYCLDLATGAERWRFLAAPAERLIVMDGQLESTWPVYGVAVHEGRVWAAAGRHAELDGGIRVWALDAASGRPLFRTTLGATPLKVAKGERVRNAPQFVREAANHLPLNGGMRVAEGKPCLVSRILVKEGSRPTTTGYNRLAKDGGGPSEQLIPIDPAWDGKAVDCYPLLAPPPKKR